ncbi:sensor histidine kinase [Mariniflexile sp. AS56]|uniref:sensor histidine kinase n=1 Tax=Mariniflexile sp. AS56 TaxID=3063957 RepID=UPI0026EAAA90|nr:GAF domain-containing sensor histidine kinase [Mariniflexile sp. AS56]MDO7172822.1 GAF domain-containing sensor histidine kinase [Mariniflexile sp. AS56]
MITPKLPLNESKRLDAVKSYNLLDTLPESDYDNITKLVASICDVPISLISLLDTNRNFLKSHHGFALNESPRDISFCGHTILNDDPIFIVEDATKDERFHDNPIIKAYNVTFYAGVTLINPQGFPLGTLCVYDNNPRKLTEKQKDSLIILGKQVVNLFELRLRNKTLNETLSNLNERNDTLKSFANKVSHDLKSPLANITSLSQLFKEELKITNPEINLEYLNYIEESADTLRAYIDGILKHYKSEESLKTDKKETTLEDVFQAIKNILALNSSNFKLLNKASLQNVNPSALEQILLNLVDNGFKYNLNAFPIVTIDYSKNNTHHIFYVKDNGMGIAPNKQDQLFDLFNTADVEDKTGNKGTGIGLYTVKTLINKLGGTIEVNSIINQETTFMFTLPK